MTGLRGWKRLWQGEGRRRPGRTRPELETLEGRWVPSSFSFNRTLPIQVGNGPQIVAAGEFNRSHDAYQDLVVSNGIDGTLTTLVNDGVGNLNPSQVLRVGDAPEGIAVSDFNLAGYPDLAVANYSSHDVSILEGNGNGTFTPQTPLDFHDAPAAANPVGPDYLAAGKLTGSGLNDLVISDFNNNRVLVYLGQGNGTFAFHEALSGNGIVNPEQVVLTDLDGDGNLDLAVANKGSNVLSEFRGDGTGNFTPAPDPFGALTFPAGFNSIGLAAADFNGDGKPDLAVADFGSNASPGHLIYVLVNNSTPGTISFKARFSFDSFDGQGFVNLVAADLNGDGRPDLAATSTYNNKVYLLPNESPGPCSISFGPFESVDVGKTPEGLTCADLNGDGLPELVTANYGAATVSLLSNGSAQFQVSATTDVTAGVPFQATVSAVTLDGQPIPNYIGTVMLGSSDGSFSPPAPYTFGAADGGSHTFTLTLQNLGPQTLTAAAPALLASVTGSTTVTVQPPSAATSLAFLQQPADTTAGQTLGPVTVEVLDGNGNVVTSDNSAVTLALAANPGGATLSGTLTVSAVNGIATFSDLSLDQPGSGYTLSAMDAGLTSAASNPFNVSAGTGGGGGGSGGGGNGGGNLDENEAFVAGLYHDLLGRSPTAAEETAFQAPLDQARAAAQGQVASMILGSAEHRSDLAANFLSRFLPARAQDPGYINFFGSELATLTDEQVVAQVVGSDEYYQDQGGTDLNWLQALYPALLGRPLDSAGLNYFGGQLGAGVSRQAVAAQVLASQEYRTALVQADYQQYLGHPAPAGGISYFVGLLQAGQTDERVQVDFLQSGEYFQGHGNTSAGWLAAVYPDLLGRPLDDAGFGYFGTALYNGFAAQRQAAVSQILSSPAYETDLVNGYYLKYLGRPVSPADMSNYWFGQFASGQTLEQVQAQILGSAEYFARNGSENTAWLTQVFAQVLGRPLDPAGRGFFLGLLNGGASRQGVAQLILSSQEYQTGVIAGAYQTYLGRPASASDVSIWLDQYQSGLTTAGFLGQVLQSVEFYQHVQSGQG